MKKAFIVAMLFPAFVAFADDNVGSAKIAKEREEWTKQHFTKQGSPVPDGGVTVMPEQQMSEYKTLELARQIDNNG